MYFAYFWDIIPFFFFFFSSEDQHRIDNTIINDKERGQLYIILSINFDFLINFNRSWF